MYDDSNIEIKPSGDGWSKIQTNQMRPQPVKKPISASISALLPKSLSGGAGTGKIAATPKADMKQTVQTTAAQDEEPPPSPINAAEVELTKQKVEALQRQQADADQYDPSKPNDYELYVVERTKVAELEKRLRASKEGTTPEFHNR
jgi:hypothetical protein